MKKHVKKLLAMTLAIVMILSAVPLTSLFGNIGFLPTAEAATVTKTQVENKLNELAKSGSRYAPGKGWGRGQCWTFINTLSKRIFGTSVDSTTPRNGVSECQIELTLNNYYKVSNTLYNASAADAAALLRQAQPGDVIGYRTADHVKSGNNWGHIVMVYKKTNSKIYVYHAASGAIRLDDWSISGALSGWGVGSFENCKSFKNGITLYRHKRYNPDKVAVSMPTFSPRNVDNGVEVTIKSGTSGAAIYYTTDGRTPTTESKKYSSPIRLTTTTNFKAIAVKSGFENSSVAQKKITIDKTATPKITAKISAEAFSVTISKEKGSTVYYTTDGSTPTKSSQKYTGPFLFNGEGATIKAIAFCSGKTASAVASSSLSATVPSSPGVHLDGSASVCGISDKISVKWNEVPNAYQYIATLYKDGTAIEAKTTQGCVSSFVMPTSGNYTIRVKAENFIGTSAESSPPISITVKPDVKVSFVDYDGKVLDTQTIKYNGSAKVPVAPSRKGYTFTRWDGKYSNITSDCTVRAVYTANTYNVKFVNEAGTVLRNESVNYGGSVINIPTAPEKTGYKFVAWSVKSGEGDSYTSVNGNVVFEPSYVWSNVDMPLGISISKALRGTDASTYDVTVKITNSTSKKIEGKLITVIKTKNDKVVATKIDVVNVPANSIDLEQKVTVGGTEVGTVAEAYIVANDSSNYNRTGGAYSEKAQAAVTQEVSSTTSYWNDWSEWSTTVYTESATKNVESKVQYRYRDKQTTTSKDSNLSGWTKTGSTIKYGPWSSWSGWKETKENSTATKDVQVDTRTAYKYQHYCDGTGKRMAPFKDYSSWAKYGAHVLYFTKKQPISRYSQVESLRKYPITDNLSPCSKGMRSYYYMGTVTQYDCRSRSKTTIYSYEKWGSYSGWSDTIYTASNTRQIEKRTVYRYRDLITVSTTESTQYLGQENLSGVSYKISGSLKNVVEDYSGKTATVLVYKDKNTDPSESQIEYVGEIVLGSGNSYDFSFIPKEAISIETGNYIVSFGIATANGLINNVETIQAPLPTHNVVFKDCSGNIVSSQTVEHGKNAAEPSPISMDGYYVTWDRSFTNVTSNLEIHAIAEPKTYNIVFVDWANSKIVDIKEAKYGEKISFPANCKAEGKIFKGWSVPADSTVTGTMIVEAIYDDITYTVTFLNKDGSVYSTQTVHYGEATPLPEEDPVAAGFQFIGWDSSNNWWNITSDVTISPIFIYNETVEAPVISDLVEKAIIEAPISFETTTSGATIRYTTDGSDPTEESLVFDDTIWVEETTTIKARAFKVGMNPSPVAEAVIDVTPYEEYVSSLPEISAITNTDRYKIGETTASLCMRIDNPNNYEINSWGYYITNISTGEIVKNYENNSVSGTSDAVVGRVFNIDGLKRGTQYKYVFFATFNSDDVEPISSEPLTFKTLGTSEPDPSAAQITVENVTAHAGDEISVKVYVKNNPGFMYMKVRMYYDPSVLEFLGAENGTVSTDAFEIGAKTGDLMEAFIWNTSSDATGDGLLVTLKFKVAENAEVGEYSIKASPVEAYNYNEDEVTFVGVSSSINVVDFIYGDVNGDGKINGRDVVKLAKYLAAYNESTGESSVAVSPGADVNGDGKINGRDLVKLRKYLANYNESTGESTIVLGPSK